MSEHHDPIRPPAVRGSDTSEAAARAIRPAARKLRHTLLAAFTDAGAAGLTETEATDRTGIAGNSLRPRRRELHKLGLIHNTGRKRPTPSGRAAAVWAVVTGGEA